MVHELQILGSFSASEDEGAHARETVVVRERARANEYSAG